MKISCSALFVFLTFFLGKLSAQNLNTDSLKKVLPQAKVENRLFILNELGTNLREVDPDLALDYLYEAEKFAEDTKNLKALSKAKENIGWIFYRKGQWQQSFEYSEEAYQLALESSSLVEAARVLNNMGALHYAQENYNLAIQTFKEAYQLSQSTEDLYTQIRSLNNVAFNFTLIEELDSAMFYATKAIATNINAGSPYLTSFTHRVIGDVYVAKNQLDSAVVTYQTSMVMAEKQGFVTFKASLYHRLGNTYLLQGKLEQAEEILKEGIKISSENQLLDELQKSHKLLAKVYQAKGDIRAAYYEQSKYLNLNDSLLNKETKNRLALMQGMFENDLRRKELELLKSQNEAQATRLDFVNQIIYLISIAGILILGLGIWLIRLNKKTREQNRDLAQKSKELEEINQTKNKLFSIIGHDLRGPVGQVKSIVDLLIAGYLDKDEFEELIQSLRKDVDSVYLTLNNTLKWSLAQMDGFKIKSKVIALQDLINPSLIAVQPVMDEKNISIQVSITPETKVLADLDLMQIVLRNIFNNAIKFSKSGQTIEVNAELIDKQVILCIKDHGTGMSEEQITKILAENIAITDSSLGTQAEKGSGLGLQICKEFAKMNGGELFISSELSKGTKVCISLQRA